MSAADPWVVVNGRFLRATPTGLGRVARSLLTAALDAGLQADVVAPPGTTDPLVTRPTRFLPGRAGDRFWEQTVLPSVARGRTVLSLTNTAPLLGDNVMLVHDLAPLVGPQWFASPMRLYGKLVVHAARRARRVCTISEQVRDELLVAGIRGPITLVRPAADPNLVRLPDHPTAAALQELGVTTPFLLFVGWTDPRKDVATAIAAHLRIVQRTPHELVVVGLPRPIFPPVTIPDAPSIRRFGFVSDLQLRALLSGAAALVYPSRYEGFGLPPLEAWQCGTPALVSDLPAIREATENRAVYLPPGDVDSWSDAMQAALRGEILAPGPVRWTWDDAASGLLSALGIDRRPRSTGTFDSTNR